MSQDPWEKHQPEDGTCPAAQETQQLSVVGSRFHEL